MTDIKRYVATVPKERRPLIDALHALIMRLYPDATVDMQYKMPTYHASEGWIAIANQKNYVSLYTCGAHHLESFKKKHPGIKTGKGCINFRPTDILPIADVEDVVRHAIEHPKNH